MRNTVKVSAQTNGFNPTIIYEIIPKIQRNIKNHETLCRITTLDENKKHQEISQRSALQELRF